MTPEIQRKQILDLMSRVEDLTGKMFHEKYPELEDDIFCQMDRDETLVFYINKLSKLVDELS